MARKENPLKRARRQVDDIDTIIFDSIGGPGAPGMSPLEFIEIMMQRGRQKKKQKRKKK